MVPDTYSDLFWSYTAVWFILSVYVAFLGYRVSALERSVTGQQGGRSSDESAASTRSSR
jgi:CcmD family protein